MCFDLDSRPPIDPIAGGAFDGRRTTLTGPDGNRLAAFHARAAEPNGSAIVILPDVRGLHPYYEELALRFAEHGIDALALDYFGRTAGVGDRGDDFEFMPHVMQTTWAGVSADIAAAAEAIRSDRDGAAGSPSVAVGSPRPTFTIGFCFGGRMSFLAGTLGLGFAGVIGLYGSVEGASRNDSPAPIDRVGSMTSPVLGLFGGDDLGISAASIAAFDTALGAAGTPHRMVTYPGAPHSFFDRKAADHAEASQAAWGEILGFIGQHAVRIT
jgi:carboxymethylenebutenolidase